MPYEFIGGPNAGTSSNDIIFGMTWVLDVPVGPPTDVLDNSGQTLLSPLGLVATALQGFDGNDVLIGDYYDPVSFDTESDKLYGGAGNDVLYGDTANYVSVWYDFGGYIYDIGLDALFNSRAQGSTDFLYGGTGNDTMYGGGGADWMWGEHGNDTMNGGYGDDIVHGGHGADKLWGGTGFDDFRYSYAYESGLLVTNRDVIFDFQPNIDDIDLSAMDANSRVAGNQAFTWIGFQGFHGRAGELHIRDLGPHVVVEGDVNGDRRADFQILVANVAALTAADFIR